MRAGWLALLLVSAALVGCLGDDGSPSEDGQGPGDASEAFDPLWYEKALGDGHDHEDRELHANLTTPNFETIGWDPLISEMHGTPPGGSSCADTSEADDGRTLGAQKAADSRGVVITDLTDVTQPRLIGELFLTATHIYDVAVVPDGQHIALVTSQPKESPPPEPTSPPSQTARIGSFETCTGETVPLTLDQSVQDPAPRPTSLLLVDISDPEQPEIVDQRPISALGHGVFATDEAGEPWVMAITEGLLQGTRHYHLYRVTEGPGGAMLEPLSVHAAQPKPEHLATVEGHSDAWLKTHPGTGQMLGYLAAGTYLEIVDYSDPTMPERVGTFTDIADLDTESDHNIHSVHAMDELVDGTHYTILGPELSTPPEDTPSGIVWVLDTTDPSDPRAIAGWTLPAEVTWEGSLQFSTHYLTVHEGTLFVSMYHGGIWAVDLTDVANGTPEDPVSLPSIGVYVPAREAPEPDPSYSYSWIPNLEEVFALEDGTLVTYDSNTGVYTFRFDDANPAPVPEPWPIEPPP